MCVHVFTHTHTHMYTMHICILYTHCTQRQSEHKGAYVAIEDVESLPPIYLHYIEAQTAHGVTLQPCMCQDTQTFIYTSSSTSTHCMCSGLSDALGKRSGLATCGAGLTTCMRTHKHTPSKWRILLSPCSCRCVANAALRALYYLH